MYEDTNHILFSKKLRSGGGDSCLAQLEGLVKMLANNKHEGQGEAAVLAPSAGMAEEVDLIEFTIPCKDAQMLGTYQVSSTLPFLDGSSLLQVS